MRTFSEFELDALREFTNVGTAHAATALSKLIDKKITVSIPKIKMMPVKDVPAYLGGPDLPVIGLYFRINGDLAGSILLCFPQDMVHTLIDLLTVGMGSKKVSEFGEVEQSALMELGNIVTNSFLNALAEMMETKLLLSVPYYSADFLGAVIDFLLIELSQVADYALLMDTVIESEETKFAGNLIVFPDEASLQKILEKAGLE